MYTPTLARFTARDPMPPDGEPLLLGFIRDTSAFQQPYAYAKNSPLLYVDPSGLKCRVCNSGIRYRVSVASLDAYVVGKAYTRLAGVIRLLLQAKSTDYVVPKLLSTGVYDVLSKKKDKLMAFFFFFVDWDICEKKPDGTDDPGACRLFVDETGSTTIWDDGRGVEVFRPRGDVTDSPEVSVPKRKPPLGICNKTMIFADAPVAEATKGNGFKLTTKQVLKVKDRDSGDVIDTVSHTIRIDVDKKFNVTASP